MDLSKLAEQIKQLFFPSSTTDTSAVNANNNVAEINIFDSANAANNAAKTKENSVFTKEKTYIKQTSQKTTKTASNSTAKNNSVFAQEKTYIRQTPENANQITYLTMPNNEAIVSINDNQETLGVVNQEVANYQALPTNEYIEQLYLPEEDYTQEDVISNDTCASPDAYALNCLDEANAENQNTVLPDDNSFNINDPENSTDENGNVISGEIGGGAGVGGGSSIINDDPTSNETITPGSDKPINNNPVDDETNKEQETITNPEQPTSIETNPTEDNGTIGNKSEGDDVLGGGIGGGAGVGGGSGYVGDATDPAKPSETGLADSSEIAENIEIGPNGEKITFEKFSEIIDEKIEKKQIKIEDVDKFKETLMEQEEPEKVLETLENLQEKDVDIEKIVQDEKAMEKIVELSKEDPKKVAELTKEEVQKLLEKTNENQQKEAVDNTKTTIDNLPKTQAAASNTNNIPNGEQTTNNISNTKTQQKAKTVNMANSETGNFADNTAKKEPIVASLETNWTSVNISNKEDDEKGGLLLSINKDENNKTKSKPKKSLSEKQDEYVQTEAMAAANEEFEGNSNNSSKSSSAKSSKKASKDKEKSDEKNVQAAATVYENNNTIIGIDKSEDINQHEKIQQQSRGAIHVGGTQAIGFGKDSVALNDARTSDQRIKSNERIPMEYTLQNAEPYDDKTIKYYHDKDIQIDSKGNELTLASTPETVRSAYRETYTLNGEKIANYYDENAAFIAQDNETRGISVVKAGDNGKGYIKYDSEGNIIEISKGDGKAYAVKQNGSTYNLVEIESSFTFVKKNLNRYSH